MNSSQSSPSLDATFSALADPTRRAIVARLALGEATVLELAQPFSISQPAISRHLKVLENAGLVVVGQDAQRRPRRLDAKAMADAMTWMERHYAVWEANFARLDQLLTQMQSKPPARPRKSKRT